MKKIIGLIVVAALVAGGVMYLRAQNNNADNNVALPSSVTAKYDEIKAKTPEGQPFLTTIESCQNGDKTIYKVTTSNLNGTSYYYQDTGEFIGQYEFSDIDVPGTPQQKPPVDTSAYTCSQLNR